MMKKEDLVAMGLTEEQAEKVMGSLDGDYVTKARFNEVNEELKTAKASVSDRDKQLEELKKSAGDNAALTQQIADLQKTNAEQKKAHEEEMRRVRIDNAADLALSGAGARNNVAAKALLAGFLETAALAEDGTVKGLDAEVRRLAEGEETSFLFERPGKPEKPGLRGAKPAESGDLPPAGMTLERFRAMRPAERHKYSVEHPDEYRAMYENGGK